MTLPSMRTFILRGCRAVPILSLMTLVTSYTLVTFLCFACVSKCVGPDRSPTAFRDGELLPATRLRTGEGPSYGDITDTEPAVLRYEALFSAFSRSLLGKRQDEGPEALKNNEGLRVENLQPGQTKQYRFSAEELKKSPTSQKLSVPPTAGQSPVPVKFSSHSELRRRQDKAKIFITLSICSQPGSVDAVISADPPPPLELYISSEGQCNPGAQSNDEEQEKRSAVEGLAKYSAERTEDVCIAVYAPRNSGYTGSYSFQIAASIDTYYTDFYNWSSLYLLDSDSQGGIFISTNLTDSSKSDVDAINTWNTGGSPFSIFVHNTNDSRLLGLTNSYCALNETAQVRGNSGASSNSAVEVGITTIGIGPNPTAKQQFYVPGLNASSSYFAFLGLSSNYSQSTQETATGGGILWRGFNFTTKTGRPEAFPSLVEANHVQTTTVD